MQRVLCVLVLAMVSAGVGSSQSAEIGLTVGVSAFNNNGIGSIPSFDDGLIPATLGKGVRIGARWATNSWVFLGHEFSYAYQRTSLKIGANPSSGMTVQNLYYNFVAHATPSGTFIRPFGTGGRGCFGLLPARRVVAIRRRGQQIRLQLRWWTEVQTQRQVRSPVRCPGSCDGQAV